MVPDRTKTIGPRLSDPNPGQINKFDWNQATMLNPVFAHAEHCLWFASQRHALDRFMMPWLRLASSGYLPGDDMTNLLTMSCMGLVSPSSDLKPKSKETQPIARQVKHIFGLS